MPRKLSFVTLDVFTRQRYAGNPLAVVLLPDNPEDQDKAPKDKEAISTGSLQLVAREFNLSETVFVYPARASEKDGVLEWRIRIFLVNAEITFAGHPTIGAACHALGVLAPNAPLSHARLLCNAGPIEVSLESGTGVARAAIPHNIHVHTQHALTAESVLSDFQPGLQASDIVADGVAIVSPVKGMTFALIELSSLEALGRVRLSAQASQVVIQRDQDWDVGFTGSYFYFVETRGDDYHEPRKPWRIRSRMVEGSIEDPATGSAACALTGFLALREGTSADFEITQGVEMGRKSDIGVSVTLRDDGKGVERMELSGCSVPVMDGTLYL